PREGSRERQPLRGRAAERLGGREREHRADALAAGEERIAHRLLEPRGAGLGGEAKVLQICVDLVLKLCRVGGGLHASAQRSRSWPSDSAAPRARASISAPSRAAI